MKFTAENVKRLRPPAGKADHWVEDESLPGFFVRFRNGGDGTFFIRYSLAGADRKLSLGKVRKVDLDKTRGEARQCFAMIAKGDDPAIERAKAAVANGVLMASMFEGFEAHLRNLRRSEDYIKRTMDYLRGTATRTYFKPLHVIPLSQLNRATVARELSRIESENGPIAMSRARAALSKFMSWCRQQGHEFVNPVEGTVKYESEERDRVLKPDELRIIWQTAGDDDYGKIVKLLMLTAARRSQIGDLKKAEVKLDASAIPTQDRLIELPGQTRKNSRKGGSKHSDPFLIPLSKHARAILEAKAKTPRENSDFVFGNGKGAGGFSGWSACKERHCERIGDAIVEPWGFHDFRRSFQTLGHDVLGIPEVDLDHCINHKPSSKQGVRGRYNFATHLKEKRAAMEGWGDFIASLIKPRLAVAG